MTKQNFCAIMKEIERLNHAIDEVEKTGIISFHYAESNLNIVDTVSRLTVALEAAVNDNAGFITYCLDSFIDCGRFVFDDVVVSPQKTRTFKNWEDVYDFLNSNTFKQNMEEYSKLFWG